MLVIQATSAEICFSRNPLLFSITPPKNYTAPFLWTLSGEVGGFQCIWPSSKPTVWVLVDPIYKIFPTPCRGIHFYKLCHQRKRQGTTPALSVFCSFVLLPCLINRKLNFSPLWHYFLYHSSICLQRKWTLVVDRGLQGREKRSFLVKDDSSGLCLAKWRKQRGLPGVLWL